MDNRIEFGTKRGRMGRVDGKLRNEVAWKRVSQVKNISGERSLTGKVIMAEKVKIDRLSRTTLTLVYTWLGIYS